MSAVAAVIILISGITAASLWPDGYRQLCIVAEATDTREENLPLHHGGVKVSIHIGVGVEQ